MISSSISGRVRVFARAIAAAAGLVALSACSPDSLVKSDPPSNIIPSDAVSTPAAATALYNGAVSLFASAFGGGSYAGALGYVRSTAVATDEISLGYGEVTLASDFRNSSLLVFSNQDNIETSGLYTFLQTARTGAFQARQALQAYLPNNHALIGRMYAYEAYTITMLAEYFCSGIPLSETPLNGGAVFASGSTTDEMLARASALFDTAITLSADSSTYLNMAKVGKGRVLLDQAKFPEAAAAVAGVPLTFVHNVALRSGTYIQIGGLTYNVWNYLTYPYNQGTVPYIVLDREGGNGLPWSTDPRVPLSPSGGVNYPSKYGDESSPIRLADGIEARMIEAEASLKAGTGDWLTILNTVRATCTSASGCAPVPGISAGTLPALTDSGTAVGRLRQVMSERAYWMYATGHRQGDLRRMLRPPYSGAPYNLTQSQVYPSGLYSNPRYTGATAAYGNDVVALPAPSEKKQNLKYAGCFDQNP